MTGTLVEDVLQDFLDAQGSSQFRDLSKGFVTVSFFYGEGLLTLRPTPKLEDHP